MLSISDLFLARIHLQLLVEDTSLNWVMLTLDNCVNEDNVLEISSLFCDLGMLIAKNDELNIFEQGIIGSLKNVVVKIRASLRRLECILFDI